MPFDYAVPSVPDGSRIDYSDGLLAPPASICAALPNDGRPTLGRHDLLAGGSDQRRERYGPRGRPFAPRLTAGSPVSPLGKFLVCSRMYDAELARLLLMIVGAMVVIAFVHRWWR